MGAGERGGVMSELSVSEMGQDMGRTYGESDTHVSINYLYCFFMRCIRKESLAISRRKHFFISAQFTSAQISIAQVNLGKWRQTTHKLRRTRCPVFFGWKINLVLRQLLIGQQRFQGWKVG